MFDIRDHGGLPHPVLDARFYAGTPTRRLAAFAIDLVAATLLGLATAALFGVLTLGAGLFVAAPAFALTAFLYRWLSIARWSATPGMLLAGIELRRHDGDRFTQGDAFVHTALFSLAMAMVIPQVLSIATMATSPVGRGLHDMALGSTAINRPA